MSIEFNGLEEALASLQVALKQTPLNELERDGTIQRFKCCFNFTWKMAQRVLQTNGIDSASPKSIVRDLAQQGWIKDDEQWMRFLDARNMTSHIYKKDVAETVFQVTPEFLKECQALLVRLKKEAKS